MIIFVKKNLLFFIRILFVVSICSDLIRHYGKCKNILKHLQVSNKFFTDQKLSFSPDLAKN